MSLLERVAMVGLTAIFLFPVLVYGLIWLIFHGPLVGVVSLSWALASFLIFDAGLLRKRGGSWLVHLAVVLLGLLLTGLAVYGAIASVTLLDPEFAQTNAGWWVVLAVIGSAVAFLALMEMRGDQRPWG